MSRVLKAFEEENVRLLRRHSKLVQYIGIQFQSIAAASASGGCTESVKVEGLSQKLQSIPNSSSTSSNNTISRIV